MKKKKLKRIIKKQDRIIENQNELVEKHIQIYKKLNMELHGEKEQRKLWMERCMQLRREKTDPKYTAYRSEYSEIDGEWIEKRYQEGDLFDHPKER